MSQQFALTFFLLFEFGVGDEVLVLFGPLNAVGGLDVAEALLVRLVKLLAPLASQQLGRLGLLSVHFSI